jgi:hypothetical protein
MDPKKNKKLKENLEFEGEKLGNSYPTERVSWGSLLE